jgi:hypothetical protein
MALEVNHLGMTLQWAPRLPVDIDNLTIWVTWEVDPNVDHNIRHLLVDLGLASVNKS